MDVRNKCGDPDYVGQRVEKRKRKEKVRQNSGAGYSEEVVEEREVEILLDEWIYDLGPRSSCARRCSRTAVVVQTATGDYGSKRR